jgi:hypothetical protein
MKVHQHFKVQTFGSQFFCCEWEDGSIAEFMFLKFRLVSKLFLRQDLIAQQDLPVIFIIGSDARSRVREEIGLFFIRFEEVDFTVCQSIPQPRLYEAIPSVKNVLRSSESQTIDFGRP